MNFELNKMSYNNNNENNTKFNVEFIKERIEMLYKTCSSSFYYMFYKIRNMF